MEPLRRDSLLPRSCQWNDPDSVSRSEVFSSVKDIFPCAQHEAVHEWSVAGWNRSLKSKPSWEARRNQGRVPIFASPLCCKYKKACAWRGFQKLTSFQRSRSFSPHSQTSHHSAVADQRKYRQKGSEQTVNSASWTPLSETSHFNAGAIWGSLYRAVVSDWSLVRSPGRRAGPWGWLWWCAVA